MKSCKKLYGTWCHYLQKTYWYSSLSFCNYLFYWLVLVSSRPSSHFGLWFVLCSLPFTVPAGLMYCVYRLWAVDMLCLPSLRGWCIVFTVPAGLMYCVYRPSLWGWYVVFTVPERLICCVYRRPWGAGVHFLCLPFFFRSRVGPGSTCLLTYRPSFLWDRWCVVFTVPAGMMYCVYHPYGVNLFYLPSLWDQYVLITIPVGPMSCVYRPCGADTTCSVYRPCGADVFYPKNSKLTHEK